mgnify:FL=1
MIFCIECDQEIKEGYFKSENEILTCMCSKCAEEIGL